MNSADFHPSDLRLPNRSGLVSLMQKRRILDGSLNIYRGPLRNNEGATVIPSGTTLKIEDVALDRMDYLVEGVDGSARG